MSDKNFSQPCDIFFWESRKIGARLEHRIRRQQTHRNDAPTSNTPSNRLSQRARGKIIDAAAHVQARGGFNIFITLTIDHETRAALSDRKIRLQSEVSRTIGALRKLYSRGSKKLGIPQGNDEAFDYIWVVEAPRKVGSTENPHAHIILRWNLGKKARPALRSYLKHNWGLGEIQLKSADSAMSIATYLAKNAEHHNPHQGHIEGHRYGISYSARPPKWEIVDTFNSNSLSQYIFKRHNELKYKTAHLYKERKQLASEKRRSRVQLRKSISNKDLKQRIFRRISAVQYRLNNIQSKIDEIPIKTNGYQITCSSSEVITKIFNEAPLSEILSESSVGLLQTSFKPISANSAGKTSAFYGELINFSSDERSILWYRKKQVMYLRETLA